MRYEMPVQIVVIPITILFPGRAPSITGNTAVQEPQAGVRTTGCGFNLTHDR
jgi:hypothetical protein